MRRSIFARNHCETTKTLSAGDSSLSVYGPYQPPPRAQVHTPRTTLPGRAIAVASAAPAAERYWLGQKVLQDHNDIEQGLLLVCGACAELEVEARAQCWALFNQLSGPTYSSSLQQCAEAAGAAAPIRR